MTRSDSVWTSVRWTLGQLPPYSRSLVTLGGLSVVEVALGLIAPWSLKILVDNVFAEQSFPQRVAGPIAAVTRGDRVSLLLLVVVGGFLLQVVSQMVSTVHTGVQVATGQRMVLDLRARLFEHLQSLGLRHHTVTNTGDAVYRLDSDAYCLDNLIMTGLFPLASATLTLVVMFIVLARLDPQIAALSLVIVPLLYACLRYYSNTLMARAEGTKELESRLVEGLYETFGAITLVKGFAREAWEATRFAKSSSAAAEARIRLTWQEALFSATVTSITLAGTALVLFVGGLHVLRGQLTIGALLVVVAYLAAVFGPLSAIAHTAGSAQQALASVRRMRDVLALEPEVRDESDGLDAAGIRGEISFEDVTFGYDPTRPVLEHITFTARPGELVALVGPTGAGKSSLLSLIPRFYDPLRGSVRLDGIEVRRYRLRSLREQIALVLQDPLLFGGTIADAIRYGRLDASMEDVKAAARAAHADEFIMRLKHGYDTAVAEGGRGLSGGERQRLSIARALLKAAPILILDEPTSALDAISEAAVFHALNGQRERRTTLVIAHRLSTVRHADRILLLDRRTIVAQGTHAELLASSTLYRQMCLQLAVDPSTMPDRLLAASEWA